MQHAQNETDEQERKAAARQRTFRLNETEDQRQKRLLNEAARQRNRRQNENEIQRKIRQLTDADRKRISRQNENELQRKIRLLTDADRKRNLRQNETEEQRQIRRNIDADRKRIARGMETQVERENRRAVNAARMRQRRTHETKVKREYRRKCDAARVWAKRNGQLHLKEPFLGQRSNWFWFCANLMNLNPEGMPISSLLNETSKCNSFVGGNDDFNFETNPRDNLLQHFSHITQRKSSECNLSTGNGTVSESAQIDSACSVSSETLRSRTSNVGLSSGNASNDFDTLKTLESDNSDANGSTLGRRTLQKRSLNPLRCTYNSSVDDESSSDATQTLEPLANIYTNEERMETKSLEALSSTVEMSSIIQDNSCVPRCKERICINDQTLDHCSESSQVQEEMVVVKIEPADVETIASNLKFQSLNEESMEDAEIKFSQYSLPQEIPNGYKSFGGSSSLSLQNTCRNSLQSLQDDNSNGILNVNEELVAQSDILSTLFEDYQTNGETNEINYLSPLRCSRSTNGEVPDNSDWATLATESFQCIQDLRTPTILTSAEKSSEMSNEVCPSSCGPSHLNIKKGTQKRDYNFHNQTKIPSYTSATRIAKEICPKTSRPRGYRKFLNADKLLLRAESRNGNTSFLNRDKKLVLSSCTHELRTAAPICRKPRRPQCWEAFETRGPRLSPIIHSMLEEIEMVFK